MSSWQCFTNLKHVEYNPKLQLVELKPAKPQSKTLKHTEIFFLASYLRFALRYATGIAPWTTAHGAGQLDCKDRMLMSW